MSIAGAELDELEQLSDAGYHGMDRVEKRLTISCRSCGRLVQSQFIGYRRNLMNKRNTSWNGVKNDYQDDAIPGLPYWIGGR